MKNTSFNIRNIDRAIWETELENFVPSRIFDFHTHLWAEKHKGRNRNNTSPLRMEVNMKTLRKISEKIFPDRQIDFLALGTPLKNIDMDAHNSWVAGEVIKEKKSYAGMVVTPEMSPDYLEKQVKKYAFKILKPYRVFAKDPANSRIKDFLPEPVIDMANSLALGIVLHISKKSGINDKYNLNDLREYTKKYPLVQWVLAHCARAFNPFTLEKAIHELKDIPNIWYDTSAVNDLYSHIILLRHENIKRIMFGSDNVAAGCMRGKYITYAHAWEGYKGNVSLEHCNPEPTFVIYEQLRAQRQAAEILGLGPEAIKDIFYNNAQSFFKCLKMKGKTKHE
ncbi:MAG: class III aminotransferase [Candidatus Uhrbacteria bacterium GW2011_GWF2_39_13]|uniref:Class III aminotransferase n=1 Tax=Candidatus Uhrbacteria bacterium GW2011_GWF2_39_13 TaxID=1618995 RepID=A0A0G0QRX0_9BACT|nr:MAG: class III aminotransferase [Candidatus Uhrbacteria bacterium GW2011_GWF2_39_13]